ncbi:hypothetical protein [Novosphingobium sp.]|uniref:hypothetical protein n=1 Tax=Novosphingobium sp. TaxID=1874826 RepID=UPI0025CF6CB1|nr:hypothetical protein [Novosphingobium sp.]MCC6925190.1 hypothetical protein [Novosphingobium sp.]
MNQSASRTIARIVLVTAWIIALVWITSATVGLSARQGFLVMAALPLPLIPILGLHFLRDREARAGWAVFTLWLGSTYAGLGTGPELAVFAAIAVLAALGFFWKAWCFPLAWFGHIAWDFMPRELPALLIDLPTACMIFDGIIGIYLIQMARQRWP